VKDLWKLVVAVLVIVLVVNVATGSAVGFAVPLLGILASLTSNLRLILIAVALPVLLLGGLLYVSPWHRGLAVRVMVGALVVLAIAVLGPAFLSWLQARMSEFGQRVATGVP
jgi:hypothetical protein